MMKTYFTLFVMTIFFLVSAQGQLNWDQGNLLELSKQKWIKKSMLLLVGLFIFTSVVLKAQSPQKINFQSIVRNTSGVIVSNKSVNFKITILSGTITGTPVYSETHLKTTDAIGLVSLQIGTGTVVSGVFSSIDWGNALHFIKLEADFSGGNTYVTLGTQELMSVPYALYSAKTDTNSLNLMNRFAAKAPINNPTFTGTVGGITQTMVGLGNVDNTSDANKPVSAATQTALDAKAPLASPTFTGTVVGITKAMVGLGSVDNTTDASKPVSTATQTALDLKAPIISPTFTGTVGGITKTMVGLGNVDNTTDAGKPISTATQTALDNKVNKTDTATMLSTYLRKADAIITDLQNQVALLSSYTSLLASGLVDIDGNNYPVVKIGNQIWMKENLRVRRYNDGTAIPFDASGGTVGNGSGFTWGGLTYGAHTLYALDSTATTPSNLTKYGYLYNWYAVNDSKKLCPSGWDVPTDAEWTTLTTFLGGESVAGGKMKSTGTDYWNSPNTNATNSSGFSARPGGFRGSGGSFFNIRDNAVFWSATESGHNTAWNRYLSFNNGNVNRYNYYNKSVGASVRCLRD